MKELGYIGKTHTREELWEAQKKGLTIWALETGSDETDDILIGNRDEVIKRGEELLLASNTWSLNWVLNPIDWGTYGYRQRIFMDPLECLRDKKMIAEGKTPPKNSGKGGI